ncbi:MAG: UDP-4-amino-4,6-dideoxy-N-acetyl-beta-L-altrosamine transaminase [Patescibacteria group bacterium]
MIPYGRQSINASDIKAVVGVLKSDFLTQGPHIPAFERALAEQGNVKYALVFSSGTAALHAAYFAAGLTVDDEFITSPLTFAATANAGLYLGAKPVFADIDENGNLDPEEVGKKITSKTKAIVAVDYGGFPAKLTALRAIAKNAEVVLIEDACHALGASYLGAPIGSQSDLTVFSFHPVKSITTGEGGAVLTNNKTYYERMKLFRVHGITKDAVAFKHSGSGDWYSEMQTLGFNYRLTDIQAALGLSQLKRLATFIAKRHEKAERYEKAFVPYSSKLTLPVRRERTSVSSLHLYPIRLHGGAQARKKMFKALRAAGIGAQVHYLPVYMHPFYEALGFKKGLCPRAEAFYDSTISLPLFPDLRLRDQKHVVRTVIQNL